MTRQSMGTPRTKLKAQKMAFFLFRSLTIVCLADELVLMTSCKW